MTSHLARHELQIASTEGRVLTLRGTQGVVSAGDTLANLIDVAVDATGHAWAPVSLWSMPSPPVAIQLHKVDVDALLHVIDRAAENSPPTLRLEGRNHRVLEISPPEERFGPRERGLQIQISDLFLPDVSADLDRQRIFLNVSAAARLAAALRWLVEPVEAAAGDCLEVDDPRDVQPIRDVHPIPFF